MTYNHIDQFDHNNFDTFDIEDIQNDINSQIQLARAEDSGTREDTVNGFEAGATEIRWDGIDPALFGLTGYNTVKLSCFNNGKGMTSDDLRRLTNFSSSKGKKKGTKGHKGKGAKLSWMKTNQKGLVWISSCYDKNTNQYRVYRVVMQGDAQQEKWGRKKFFVSNEKTGVDSMECVVEITNEIDWNNLPEHFSKNSDWTLKIYCGNQYNQNTVKQPYIFGSDISEGWLLRELTKRFLSLPNGVTVIVGKKQTHLTNDTNYIFVPLYEVLKKYSGPSNDKNSKLRFETVLINKDGTGTPENIGQDYPFYVESNQCAITYVIDDFCGMGGSNAEKSYSWYKSRMGITSVFSGIGWQPHNEGQNWSELFDYKGPLPRPGGNTWRQCAAECGFLSGWRKCRIILHEGDSDEISNNEDRTQILNPKDPKSKVYELKNRRDLIWKAMPAFFTDFLEDNKVVVSAEDIRKELNERLKAMKSFLKGTAQEGGPEQRFTFQGSDKKLKCPKCGKDFPRGQKICSHCGYERKKSKIDNPNNVSNGYVQDKNGFVRIVRNFPEIVYVDKDSYKDKALCEDFGRYGGQYIPDDNKLFVNTDYSAFTSLQKKLINEVVKQRGIEITDPQYTSIVETAKEDAKHVITLDCIGQNFCIAITKSQVEGFKDEKTFAMLTDPRMISVYADTYCQDIILNPLLRKFGKKTNLHLNINEGVVTNESTAWEPSQRVEGYREPIKQ